MKQRVFALFMVLILLLSVSAHATDTETASTRVFDYAGLLTAEEAEELSAAIIDFQENTGYDFAIWISSDDLGTDDYQAIATAFAQEKSLGLGMNSTAILCYLDLSGDAYYYVSVFGDLKNLMVEEDILYLVSGAMDYFNNGDFTGGFHWTMEILTTAVTNIGNMNQTVRVYDYAGILSEDETAALEAAIADFRALSQRDFLYLSTAEELQGNGEGDYMASFYQSYGFGEGDNRSGAMLYLDMAGGNFFVQNFGGMDAVVSQEALNTIVSNASVLTGEGRILDAALQVIDAYSAYFR